MALFVQGKEDEENIVATELMEWLLDKIFNQAANEFCSQVTSVWGSGGANEGVAIKQALKVVQRNEAEKVQKKNPVSFEPDTVMAMDEESRHLHLSFICKFHPELLSKKGITLAQLKSILKVYKQSAGGKKAEVVQRVLRAVLGADGGGVGIGAQLAGPTVPSVAGSGRDVVVQLHEEEEEENAD